MGLLEGSKVAGLTMAQWDLGYKLSSTTHIV
jgi:hypothetical protein